MSLKTQTILGISITTSPKEEILEEVRKYLEKVKSQKSKVKSEFTKSLIIFTPNPEIVMYGQKDQEFMRIVNSGQINIPDGVGITWAIKKRYGIIVHRIPGVEMMEDLVKMAAKEGCTIGLIGGWGGVAVRSLECLRARYPGLKGEVLEEPVIQSSKPNLKTQNSEANYFTRLVKEIVEKQIDILFVGLGHPKQEYFINELRSQFSVLSSQSIVLMAVGGSFDIIAGKVKRAPQFIRQIGLEWAYRLLREPWRWRRQINLLNFAGKIMSSRDEME